MLFDHSIIRSASFLHRFTIKTIKELIEKPKGNVNGYSIFYGEKYQQLKQQEPNISILDAGSRIGRQWRTLAEGEKSRYQERAKTLNVANQANLNTFKESLSPNQAMALRVIRLNNKYRRDGISARNLEDDVREFCLSLPETPYTSGREAFLAQAMKGKGGTKEEARDRMKEVMVQWNRLNPAEQAQYQKKADASMQQFREQMAALLKK